MILYRLLDQKTLQNGLRLSLGGSRTSPSWPALDPAASVGDTQPLECLLDERRFSESSGSNIPYFFQAVQILPKKCGYYKCFNYQ